MTDIRKIEVEKTTRYEYEVDVDKWFEEFLYEWEEYEQDDDGREEFIKETAHELAAEDSLHLGAISIIEGYDDLEVDIYKVKS